jgi:hypothetical protein
MFYDKLSSVYRVILKELTFLLIEMIYIYLLYIFIQPSFKSTIKFVKLYIYLINSMIDLKIKYVRDISFSSTKLKR